MDQTSGVSARMPISAIEILVSNLERRGLGTGEDAASSRGSATCRPRLPAITGKVEMVYEGEQQGAEVVAKKLIGTARQEALRRASFLARTPAGRRRGGGRSSRTTTKRARAARSAAFARSPRPRKFIRSTRRPSRGSRPATSVTLSDDAPFREHLAALKSVPGLEKAVETHFSPATPEELAIGMELVLEGLTQHLKIAREDLDSRVSYTEMLKFNLVRNRAN